MADPAEHFARASLRLRGFSSRRIPTAEGEIHLMERWCSGDGPTLVMIHGLGSAGVFLRPLLNRMTPNVRRLIAVDLPAHGFSDHPRSGYDPESLLMAVFEALDSIISEPVAVFGNSLGGYTAVRYALERPERVRALLLASPAGARTGPDDLDEIRAVFDLSDHEKALDFIDRLLARPGPLRHFFAWGVRRKLSRAHFRELLEAADLDAHGFDPEALRALSIPILLVWGEADRILPTRHLDFWKESLPPHAQIEELSGMGHSPFLDRPAALSRRLATFLSSLDDGKG